MQMNNNIEEIKKEIDSLQENYEYIKKTYPSIYKDGLKEVEQFKVIIEALEKQIPKKPKHVTKKEVYDPDRPFATIDVTTFVCPCCGVKIMFRKTIQRCLECGQKLDWSDDNED